MLGAEAEAAQDFEDLVAPAVAAAGFESRLGRGVGVHRLLGGTAGHLALEPRELGLHLKHVAATGEDVVAELDGGVARRALVVEGDAGAALDRDRALLRFQLAREHAQQGRLARAVAPREGHPVAGLELERHVSEQELACHVDVE